MSKLLLRGLPTSLANKLVAALASRTQRPKLSAAQRDALEQASPLRYGVGQRNMAWSWGLGPLVVLVHGWNGCAAQLAPLALALSRRGFRCVALDITGHGESAGNRTSWQHFIDDIAALTATLSAPVHAYVGHSAGGLSMMAARALHGLQARHYVCVCAPSFPFPPVHTVQERLQPPAAVVENFKRDIARQFGAEWPQLEAGCAYASTAGELLLVYDSNDRYVEHSEGDRILGWCRGAQLIKTVGLGHTRVLAAPELEAAIASFVQVPVPAGRRTTA